MTFPQKEHFFVPIALALVIVLFHVLDFKNVTTSCLGIQPYHFSGLKGVILAPLLHADWGHLIGNVFPLMALLFLSFQFYGKITYWVLILGWIAVGLMVWMFPYATHNNYSNTCHIGASGVVYVLAFFLLFSGIFNKQQVLISLSLLIVVGFGSMVWGIFPEEFFGIKDSNVSWQSHLSGAIAGIVLSFLFRDKTVVEDKKFEWEGKQELSESDQALWDRYLELTEDNSENEAESTENLPTFPFEKYYPKDNQSSSD